MRSWQQNTVLPALSCFDWKKGVSNRLLDVCEEFNETAEYIKQRLSLSCPQTQLCSSVCVFGASAKVNSGKLRQSVIFFFFLIYFLLFYFWLHWVFVAAHRLSLLAASGDYSSLRCADFSLRWLLLLQSTGL